MTTCLPSDTFFIQGQCWTFKTIIITTIIIQDPTTDSLPATLLTLTPCIFSVQKHQSLSSHLFLPLGSSVFQPFTLQNLTNRFSYLCTEPRKACGPPNASIRIYLFLLSNVSPAHSRYLTKMCWKSKWSTLSFLATSCRGRGPTFCDSALSVSYIFSNSPRPFWVPHFFFRLWRTHWPPQWRPNILCERQMQLTFCVL